MSLEKWVEYGWLRREPTSPGQIKDLLGIVERSLADSKVEAVSTDLRFIAVFNAALSVATTALRASGHRTVTQAGHHVKTIESLELTIVTGTAASGSMGRLNVHVHLQKGVHRVSRSCWKNRVCTWRGAGSPD
jgi:hypothetical protein